MQLVTVHEMRQIEHHAHESLGWRYDDMMLIAGTRLAEHIHQMVASITNPKILFLIGKGNNGGDALIACRILANDYKVSCYLIDQRSDLKQVDQTNASIINATQDHNAILEDWVSASDLVVDGMFGIGFHLPIKENYAHIFRTVNQIIRASKAPQSHKTTFIHPHQALGSPKPIKVLAVDCPSGVDCDTGQTDPNTIPADVTLTFITPKIGLIIAPATSYVGELVIAPLGIPHEIINHNPDLATMPDMKNLLPYRPLDANKGTFGKSMIVGGCQLYYGAPALSAIACYRSGTGIVSIATLQPVINAIASQHPEPTYIPLPDHDGGISEDAYQQLIPILDNYDSLLIGVGMGTSPHTLSCLLSLLEYPLPPLILDADALNLLSKQSSWWQKLPPNTIITPHPGEMARLTGLTVPEIQANRIEIARQFSTEWEITIVLKGAHTIIASPDGQITVLPFKSPALATAGTGDILAGIITGFRAQGLSSHHASVLGGYVHGLAGAITEKRFGGGRGIMASDVLQSIPEALNQIEAS